MVHYWIDDNVKYGFYLLGFFDKRKKAGFSIQREKPFEIDHIEGTVTGKVFRTGKTNLWPKEWEFFEGQKIIDIDRNSQLRTWINETWELWCKKHRRKYHPIVLGDDCWKCTVEKMNDEKEQRCKR